jgi:hypothetical protein
MLPTLGRVAVAILAIVGFAFAIVGVFLRTTEAAHPRHRMEPAATAKNRPMPR